MKVISTFLFAVTFSSLVFAADDFKTCFEKCIASGGDQQNCWMACTGNPMPSLSFNLESSKTQCEFQEICSR